MQGVEGGKGKGSDKTAYRLKDSAISSCRRGPVSRVEVGILGISSWREDDWQFYAIRTDSSSSHHQKRRSLLRNALELCMKLM